MEIALIVLAVILALLVAIGIIFLVVHRTHNIVRTWADAEGLELLDSEYRIIRKGPFLLTSSSGQHTCRIKVRTQDGRIRCGYVKCGSFLLGIAQNRAKVVWDD